MSQPIETLFLDYGPYGSEGFTSGLMIIIKEILREFARRGSTVGIASLAPGLETSPPPGESVGIPLINLAKVLEKVSAQASDSELRGSLINLGAKSIILHVPSVFLEEICLKAFRAANGTGAQVITVLGDPIFPRVDGDGVSINELWAEVRQTEVIGVGDETRRIFTEFTGIPSRRLINPFSVDHIVVPAGQMLRDRFITMVNIHPLKGRSVFDLVAARMLDLKFMIVKNWPDAPAYNPGPNVTFVEFFDDPRELYRRTKLLLVPSLWGEGPARVVTEALCNGIPVIAHNIGSLGEFKEFGVCFVDPPKISGNNLIGTVLYPVIDPANLSRAADEFVKEIRRLLASSRTYEDASQNASDNGRRYLTISGKDFASLFDRWITEREHANTHS